MTERYCLSVLCMLAYAGLGHSQTAIQPSRTFLHNLCNWPVCPPVRCCPDDYVHKPFPTICPLRYCGEPDDYCRKPLPNVPPLFRCGDPDDYCRKPLPALLCPAPSPYLQCGPSDGSCSSCGQQKRPRLGIMGPFP
jgi:hypothetical protein